MTWTLVKRKQFIVGSGELRWILGSKAIKQNPKNSVLGFFMCVKCFPCVADFFSHQVEEAHVANKDMFAGFGPLGVICGVIVH